MKNSTKLNRSICLASIAAFTFAAGLPVSAAEAQPLTLTKLSAQVQELTMQIQILRSQVSGLGTATPEVAMESSAATPPAATNSRHGRRNKRITATNAD